MTNCGGVYYIDMNDLILKIEHLSKRYSKNQDYVIKDINLNIKKGDVIGLLGKNGVGKSTILKCIVGILSYDEGNIEILDKNILTDPLDFKKHFTFVPDNHETFEKMTGIQYLSFIADIYDINYKERKERIEELVKYFEFKKEKLSQYISEYSHGMKQKICIIGNLIPQPKLWILDEPTVGLDSNTQNKLLNYIEQYANKGNAVLFTSHNLTAVRKVCTNIEVISEGKFLDHKNFEGWKTLGYEEAHKKIFGE